MGRHNEPRRGRRLDDLRSPHGAGMVFPPSWSTGEHPDYWDDRPDQQPPASASSGGLECLSPFVREQMIASLERDGDPHGLLADYRKLNLEQREAA